MPDSNNPFAMCDACRQRKLKCYHKSYSQTFVLRDDGHFYSTEQPTPDGECAVANTEISKAVPNAEKASAEECSALLTPALSWQPTDDLLCAFFLEQITGSVGWFSYVPRLLTTAPEDGFLRAAVCATSLFALGNQRGQLQLTQAARISYAHALTALTPVFNDTEGRLKDEVLCTILILNLVDIIVGHQTSTPSSHLQACNQLLNLRQNAGVTCPGDETSYTMVIQAQLFKFGEEHDKYEACNRFGSLSSNTLHSPALQLYTLSTEVHQLECRAKLCRTHTEAELLELTHRGITLEDELASWTRDLPIRWRRHTVWCASGVAKEFFNDIQAAKLWNQYRCVRICLNKTLINLANILVEYSFAAMNLGTTERLNNVLTQSQTVIREMVAGICRTIDYHMHRIDSNGEICSDTSQQILGGQAIIPPLEVVLQCLETREEDQMRARAALEEIGYGLGVRQAVVALRL